MINLLKILPRNLNRHNDRSTARSQILLFVTRS